MILFKYLIFYSFVGSYQCVVFFKFKIQKAFHYFRSLHQRRNVKGEVVGLKTTLLRTAFRSIL